MTAKELIRELQKVNPDSKILYKGLIEDCQEIFIVTELEDWGEDVMLVGDDIY
jgi:hypothetical protein